jgi:hypothetical protein
MIQSTRIADTPDEALHELREANGFVRYPTGTLVIESKNTGDKTEDQGDNNV